MLPADFCQQKNWRTGNNFHNFVSIIFPVNTLTGMKQYIHDFLNFCFPENCPVCGNILPRPGMVLCLKCELGLPRTRYTKMPDNPVSRLFWGRVRIEAATSLFRFEKGSRYQKLMHRLKYKGDREIGLYLGRLLGEDLVGTDYASVSHIVPVPLHPDKLKARGYNQCELIAQGISDITGTDILPDLLVRNIFTETQTRRNRYDRFINVSGKFNLRENSENYPDCSFLLVDDIVTTGATLEACALPLSEELNGKVYVATVACA